MFKHSMYAALLIAGISVLSNALAANPYESTTDVAGTPWFLTQGENHCTVSTMSSATHVAFAIVFQDGRFYFRVVNAAWAIPQGKYPISVILDNGVRKANDAVIEAEGKSILTPMPGAMVMDIAESTNMTVMIGKYTEGVQLTGSARAIDELLMCITRLKPDTNFGGSNPFINL